MWKNWLFSNHCICHLAQCISMKLGTFVQWSFLAIRINPQGDFIIKSFKSGKTQKWLRSHVEAGKNLRIYSLYSLLDLKHERKRFISIPSLNVPK